MTTPSAEAKAIIMAALDEFDTDDFVDLAFNESAASKIIAELEWRGFRIVKTVRVQARSLPPEADQPTGG